MKYIALIFAILGIVPQALRGMAYGLASMSKCTLPAKVCEINGNDQSGILNMLYGPSWYTTTGLWIGGIGLVVSLVAMKIMSVISDRRSMATMNRADRRSGVGHGPGGRGAEPYDREREGGMPRPPAFDKYGRPRK